MIRLVADEHLSRRFVDACRRIDSEFPIIHLSDWLQGRYRASKDPALFAALHNRKLIIVTFVRRTMAMYASQLTREGEGHSGVILFRRNVSQMDFGKQSKVLVQFWREASNWDWSDRIEYIPKS